MTEAIVPTSEQLEEQRLEELRREEEYQKLLAKTYPYVLSLRGRDRAQYMDGIARSSKRMAGDIGRRLKDARLSLLEPWSRVTELFRLSNHPVGAFTFHGYHAYNGQNTLALFNENAKVSTYIQAKQAEVTYAQAVSIFNQPIDK